jgi:hypothetical protein
MKRTSYIVLFLFLIAGTLSAQIGMGKLSDKDLKNFKASKTIYVVLTGDKQFDESFRDAIAKYWKLSATKEIPVTDIENYLGNENNFFIAPVTYSSNGPERYTAIDIRSYSQDKWSENIAIFNGKHKKVKQYYPDQDILAEWSYVFTLAKKEKTPAPAYAVRALNDYFEYRFNNRHEADAPPTQLKEKTLLVNNAFFGMFIKEDVLKAYKYKYKAISPNELGAILNSDSKEYCYLSCLGTSYEIYDVESKKIIYQFQVGGAMAYKLKEKNLEDLNRCIEGNCKK